MTAMQWWGGLSKPQQGAIVVLAVAEIILTKVSLIDLARRPSSEVRGPKILWLLACAVQPVGPVAYLTLGRIAAS